MWRCFNKGGTLENPIMYVQKPGDTPVELDFVFSSIGFSTYHSCIGYANKPGGADFTPGLLNCAPNGVGFLLTSGYLSDAKIYYCPSADNMPPAWRTHGASRVTHWRTAGGFSGATLTHGAWGGSAGTPYGQRVMLYSHYYYRNTPLGGMNAWHKSWDGTKLTPLPGTSPLQHVRLGQPYFRTVKELGARAILADAWGKPWSMDATGRPLSQLHGQPIAESGQIAGVGLKAHRTAYNTLYGDGHVQVYGDPQERLIWHCQGLGATTHYDASCRNSLGASYFYASGGPFDRTQRTVDDAYFKNVSPAIWHGLDVQGDVDVYAK